MRTPEKTSPPFRLCWLGEGGPRVRDRPLDVVQDPPRGAAGAGISPNGRSPFCGLRTLHHQLDVTRVSASDPAHAARILRWGEARSEAGDRVGTVGNRSRRRGDHRQAPETLAWPPIVSFRCPLLCGAFSHDRLEFSPPHLRRGLPAGINEEVSDPPKHAAPECNGVEHWQRLRDVRGTKTGGSLTSPPRTPRPGAPSPEGRGQPEGAQQDGGKGACNTRRSGSGTHPPMCVSHPGTSPDRPPEVEHGLGTRAGPAAQDLPGPLPAEVVAGHRDHVHRMVLYA